MIVTKSKIAFGITCYVRLDILLVIKYVLVDLLAAKYLVYVRTYLIWQMSYVP